ncbi:MAG: undecaprenyl-phosphate galactose phosphotransferase WbaP [Rubrobacteraceae bacterium]|nr:undecaprenyl-phosphate galactose phosphotransferase WbaP [Rubrobacteraceae bacterium]
MEQRSTPTLSLASHEWLHATKTRSKPLWKRKSVPAVLIVFDVLLTLVVWEVASVLQSLYGHGPLTEVATASLVPVVVLWVGLRAMLGLYPGYGFDPVEKLRRHTYSVFIAMAMLAVFAIGFHVSDLLSRLQTVLVFSGLLVLAPFVQYLVTLGLKRIGWWGRPVVILSYKETGVNIVGLLKQNWELGYQPVAIFEYRLHASDGEPGGVDDQQALVDAVELARQQDVDTAIFAMPYMRREQLIKLVSVASGYFRHVLIIPNLSGITNSAVVARDLGGTLAVEIKYNLLNAWALRAKRMMDLCATVIGGILLLPLVLVLALLVYLESRGPVFYEDRRMGRDGSTFSCLKFRTMVLGAEDLLWQMLKEDAGLRAEYLEHHKLREDPRVTRVGRFLRKTSLDELPQLWNVLKGEMSLVGPRPYLQRESKEIGMTQSEILRVPPGMTGPWQVAGRNQTSFGDRVQMDAYYVRDWSVWLDIILLARTVKTVVLGRGAY